MKDALWRGLALVCIVLAAVFVVASPWIEVPRGDFGFSGSLRGSETGVVTVSPDSPAAAAGIKPGDRLRVADDTFANRAKSTTPLGGTQVRFIVNDSRQVLLTARNGTFDLDLVSTIVRLAFLGVAGLLTVRRFSDPCSRWLVAFLFCFGMGVALNNNSLRTPELTVIFLAAGGTAFILAGTAAAASFAATFPDGRAQGTRRILQTIAVVWTALAILFFIGLNLFSGLRQFLAFAGLFIPGAFVFSVAATIASLAIGYRGAGGAERQKRLWIFGIIAIGLLGPAIDIATTATYHFVPLLDRIASITLAVIPFGLAYVILRHRVLDVGFVLNRAAVYAGMSIVIVGVFVVVETLLAKYVENTSHVTSTAVQLAVALALGFSIRAIHSRVDRFVDTVLFRERHEAESAIRTFAHDAQYITEGGTLGARCIETAIAYGGAKSASVWLRDEQGFYFAESGQPPISENDPAIVAMRARHVIVEPARTGSALPGALALPMIVRGELIGILVCGEKAGDEGYAPDEREALQTMATAVGYAYDALEVRQIRHRLQALEAGLATGGALGMS